MTVTGKDIMMQKGIRAAILIRCSATTAGTLTTDHTDRVMKPDTRMASATVWTYDATEILESINLRIIGKIEKV
jgi:hypothetical protein